MKLLWLTNIALPAIASHLKLPESPRGGWMVGLYNKITTTSDLSLTIVFPQKHQPQIIEGKINNCSFFGFYAEGIKYKKSMEQQLNTIIEKVKPDIIHIFGTEFPHSFAMTNVFSKPDKTIISIQGLVSIYYKHYFADLPENIIKRYTIRDLIKTENLKKRKEKFNKRGNFEVKAIKQAGHFIGRTDWDKACVTQINPSAKYHFCNEILRKPFYLNQSKWNLEHCTRNSLFVSQAGYPIKGLHYILEAMPEIIKNYPDTNLYIAGINITRSQTIKEKLSITSYGKYIYDLIKKLNLKHHISFINSLDENQMCDQYLKTHVYISASTIENESNSISEAKILGVPVVASFVGGVTNRIQHNIDGFLYQHDAPYMLAYYIKKIFSDDKLANQFSREGNRYIRNIVDEHHNAEVTVNIYRKLL